MYSNQGLPLQLIENMSAFFAGSLSQIEGRLEKDIFPAFASRSQHDRIPFQDASIKIVPFFRIVETARPA